MRITALAGGIGGARFLRGLLHHLDRSGTAAEVTVIGNTADDVTLHGLRVCPDLDTVMYTLGGGVHEGQGWGRAGETFSASDELSAYGSAPDWFTLGDRDLATHIVRTRLLGQGRPLSEVTALLCERWKPGVRLLPMSDDRVETHVVIDAAHPQASPADGGTPDDAAPGGGVPDDITPGGTEPGGATPGRRAIHFQEWWVRLHAAVPARQILAVGIDQARPAPGVLEAIRDADVLLLPPSNPVVSIGTILGVPGLRDAVRDTRAPVVGVSPIIGGAPVRGMADACLTAIGVQTSAAAVAGLYADFLDGWLVDGVDGLDAAGPAPATAGVTVRTHPLLMSDLDAAAAIAGTALDLARTLAPARAARVAGAGGAARAAGAARTAGAAPPAEAVPPGATRSAASAPPGPAVPER